jgi:two-component system cell cycle response regulator
MPRDDLLHDPLTGLYSRAFLLEALDAELRRHDRYGSHCALVLLALDAPGDAVLRRAAELLRANLRPSDLVARIGGSVFGVLMPETAPFGALLAAERLRAAAASSLEAARRAHPRLGGRGRGVALGAGVAACPQDATTVEALLARARGALAFARREGLDVCAVASRRRDAVEADLIAELRERAGELEARRGTEGHQERVATCAVALAAALGLDVGRTVRLRRAALLLDVGTVAVDRELLAVERPLTDDEFAQVRLHPLVGAAMLRHAGLELEAGWVRSHHERPDGLGYPDGLRGDEPPLEARVLAVADAFEALCAERPHRHALAAGDALDELRAGAGTQFDPVVVRCLVDLVASGALGPADL